MFRPYPFGFNLVGNASGYSVIKSLMHSGPLPKGRGGVLLFTNK